MLFRVRGAVGQLERPQLKLVKGDGWMVGWMENRAGRIVKWTANCGQKSSCVHVPMVVKQHFSDGDTIAQNQHKMLFV